MYYHANDSFTFKLDATVTGFDIVRAFYGLPEPENVIFHDPATIVYWDDGTKTVVKCGEDDTYDKEKGLALCYMKKYYGNKGNFNEVLKKWCVEEEETPVKKEEEPHWIQGGEFLKCSKCGFDALFPVKRCPKCGSEMKVNWENS